MLKLYAPAATPSEQFKKMTYQKIRDIDHQVRIKMRLLEKKQRKGSKSPISSPEQVATGRLSSPAASPSPCDRLKSSVKSTAFRSPTNSIENAPNQTELPTIISLKDVIDRQPYVPSAKAFDNSVPLSSNHARQPLTPIYLAPKVGSSTHSTSIFLVEISSDCPNSPEISDFVNDEIVQNASKTETESAAASFSDLDLLSITEYFPSSNGNMVTTDETEMADEARIKQRTKQINYGKVTAGYQNYIAQVPKQHRTKDMPRTPEKNQLCSKRSWDGQVRKWRRDLHLWDPIPSPDFSQESPQDQTC